MSSLNVAPQSDVRRAYVVLTLLFHEEEDQWVGVCQELGTSSWGDTFEEASEALKELVLLDLNALEEIGERQRFFEEHGIPVHYDDDSEPSVPYTVHPGVYATAFRHDLGR